MLRWHILWNESFCVHLCMCYQSEFYQSIKQTVTQIVLHDSSVVKESNYTFLLHSI